MVAVAIAGLAVNYLPLVTWAWPERWVGSLAFQWLPAEWSLHLASTSVEASLAVEAMAGPLWLCAFLWEEQIRKGRLSYVLSREAEAKRAHQKAFASPLQSSGGQSVMTHPEATIRLGIESASHKAFDLELPGSLARHVTVLGKTGSGKTTTALRLIQGALSAGYPVVVVDAKGLGSLRRTVETLAAGLPFQLVAPGDPKSLRYNPCNGTPAQISNKLVGAFDYGPEAQIYKNIVQETLPIVARGLIAAGEVVNLASLSSALDQARMKGLATRMGDRDPEARQLLADFSNRGNLYSSAFAGMRARLGALRHGEFGPIFAAEGESPVLDLAGAFTTCGVTYVSLPTMASSEDV